MGHLIAAGSSLECHDDSNT